MAKATRGQNKYGNATGSRFVLTLSAIQNELPYATEKKSGVSQCETKMEFIKQGGLYTRRDRFSRIREGLRVVA